MNKRKMRRRIDVIPPAGWYSSQGRQSFHHLADKLLEYGIPYNVVADILTDAYEAAEDDLEHIQRQVA